VSSPRDPVSHQATTRSVVVLGSTGSVGTQALDVVRRSHGRFRVVGLAAAGSTPQSVALLADQALELGVQAVGIGRATAARDLQNALYAAATAHGWEEGSVVLPKIFVGTESAVDLGGWPCDVVLNAMPGAAGLPPTLAALDAGRTLALANKESLIIGGPLVKARAKPGQIVPVDSEHSALAQCLRGGRADEVRRLVLTASGGPFRGRSRAELASVTPADALAHPTWDMGPLVTINSATLVNKGLELIEAHLLFDLPFDRIDVVVHPQSVVHSMVEFTDGSTLAQASPPDMRLPIALALGWPDRLPDAAPGCDWTTATAWEFAPLDQDAFPAVRLAREAGQRAGIAPAVYNAVNEACVSAFLDGRLPFLRIVDTVAEVLSEQGPENQAAAESLSLEDVLAADAWARARALSLIESGTRTGSMAEGTT
jgi:1-deoxy-D-xylulose-5-phosphate reductoisomerase